MQCNSQHHPARNVIKPNRIRKNFEFKLVPECYYRVSLCFSMNTTDLLQQLPNNLQDAGMQKLPSYQRRNRFINVWGQIPSNN